MHINKVKIYNSSLISHFLLSVPHGEPSNCTLVSPNATALTVNFTVPHILHQNGIITKYRITIQQFPPSLDGFQDSLELENTQEWISHSFHPLISYVIYNVTVRAYTVVGEGEEMCHLSCRVIEAGNINVYIKDF